MGRDSFFIYGSQRIDYTLFYGKRKTMEISVLPDSTVTVKAPFDSDIPVIEGKLRKRVRWILKQIRYFRQFKPETPVRCYLNGESHLYLGKQYRLKISRGIRNRVKLRRGYFCVECYSEVTAGNVEKLMKKWYSEKADIVFKKSLERCWPKFKGILAEKPDIVIKRMAKRWGSLAGSGRLILNTDLVKAPGECIDYVVTHELCHLKYRNHSSEFYDLLEYVLPDWERIKHKLELKMV